MLVGFGGMLGSIFRYLAYLKFAGFNFPYVTLFINVAGSFLLGSVAAISIKNPSLNDWKLFLGVGVCGGFTTFSTFSFESYQLLQQNRNIAALVYVACSFAFGIAAAFAGFFLSK